MAKEECLLVETFLSLFLENGVIIRLLVIKEVEGHLVAPCRYLLSIQN